MLVLSRKRGEIVKAGDITVTVVEIRRNSVRLGFEGPRNVVIDRKEVHADKAVSYRGLTREQAQLDDECRSLAGDDVPHE